MYSKISKISEDNPVSETKTESTKCQRTKRYHSGM